MSRRWEPRPGHQLVDFRLRALPHRHHDDHRGDADDHAQRSQRAAHPVAAQGEDRGAQDIERSSCPRLHARIRSSCSSPSRITKMRSACAATSASWVIRMTVWSSSRRRLNKARISSPVLRVQRTGGLVGQQDRRLVDQRAGDGHALLLATGEFAGPVRRALAQAHRRQRFAARGACVRAGGTLRVAQRHGHVVQRAHARQQVEALEHEADLVAAQCAPALPRPAWPRRRHRIRRCRRWAYPGSRSGSSASTCPNPKAP